MSCYFKVQVCVEDNVQTLYFNDAPTFSDILSLINEIIMTLETYSKITTLILDQWKKIKTAVEQQSNCVSIEVMFI